MFGIFLAWLGSFFEEISSVVGKKKLAKKEEDTFVFFFLQCLACLTTFTVLILVFPKEFQFSWASLPIISVRIVLEIFQFYVSIMALRLADRSSFAFIRSGTIPLLLMVDLVIGYQISNWQIAGVLGLFLMILLAFRQKVIRGKGLKYMLISTVNSVLTISLYKFSITNYNSVAADQLIVIAVMLLFAQIMCIIRGQNPWKFLLKKEYLVQSGSYALGSTIESFAYMYSAASVLTAVKRSSAVFWGTLSGIWVFREQKARQKLWMAGVIMVMLVVLI